MMAPAKISSIRRRELQDAALQVASRHGIHAITLEKIARQAGTAKGIVHHYFRSKQDLLETTIRYAESLDRKAVVEGLKAADTPVERLWSVIENYWSPANYTPGLARFWLSVIGADIRDQRLAEIGTRRDSWIYAKLVSALKPLVKQREAKDIARTILYVMEGSWILTIQLKTDTREQALAAVCEILRERIPGFVPPHENWSLGRRLSP